MEAMELTAVLAERFRGAEKPSHATPGRCAAAVYPGGDPGGRSSRRNDSPPPSSARFLKSSIRWLRDGQCGGRVPKLGGEDLRAYRAWHRTLRESGREPRRLPGLACGPRVGEGRKRSEWSEANTVQVTVGSSMPTYKTVVAPGEVLEGQAASPTWKNEKVPGCLSSATGIGRRTDPFDRALRRLT
jgi:hypothetical protein